MEQLLAIVIFGILGLISVYGFFTSMRAVQENDRGGITSERPMAGVSPQ